jgi:hypothetical protein
MQKCVDGKMVDLTPQEEAAILAEWAANAARPAPTRGERVTARLDGDPVLGALIDELAEQRGLTRAALVARLAGKLA